MHGGGTIEGRAAVPVVYLVNLLVQVGIMEEPVGIITDRLVVHEQGWDGGEEVRPPIVVDVRVEGIGTC